MKYTTDGKKEFWLFCLVCLLLLCAVARLHPEPSFRIMESETTKLETIWQQSQADKQNWLSQVQKLQADSTRLNSQLLTERQATERLRKSFERLETDRLTQIDRLNTEKTALQVNLEKTKRTRDVYGVILLSILSLSIIFVFMKIKRL